MFSLLPSGWSLAGVVLGGVFAGDVKLFGFLAFSAFSPFRPWRLRARRCSGGVAELAAQAVEGLISSSLSRS
jgi:hypothetical protein